MRSGEAVALLFKLQLTGGAEASRDVRRFKSDYIKEVRALETAGQRALTVISSPVRGRLGLAGSLGISAARQALRTFATNEIEAAKRAQGELADQTAKTELNIGKLAGRVASAATSFKATRREVELFQAALERADRVNAGTRDVELRGTFKRLGVNRVQARTDPQAGLSQFAAAFNKIESAEDRASLAAEVFGRNVGAILPRLEAARTGMLGLGAASGGAAAGLSGTATAAASILVPLALAAAAVIAVAAAYAGLAAIGIKATAAVSKVGDEIYRASERTGIGAETLSVYKLAADEAKISFDTFGLGITRFQQRLVEAAEGNKNLADTFKRLGIDARAGAENPQQAFETFIKNFAASEDGAKKTAIAIQLFGESGAKMIPVLDRLGTGFDEIKARALELGVVLSDAEAKSLHDAELAFTELKNVGAGLALTLGKETAPAVTFLLRTVANAIKEMRPLIRVIGLLSSAVLADLALRVLNFVAAAGTIPTAIRETIAALQAGQEAFVGYSASAVEAGKAIYYASQFNFAEAANSATKAADIARVVTEATLNRLKQSAQTVSRTYDELSGRLTKKAADAPDNSDRDLGLRETRDKEAERREKERLESLRRARQQALENEVADAALAYKRETEEAEAQYAERLIDIDIFVRKSVEAEDKLLKARLANFEREKDEARRVSVERKQAAEELAAELAAIELKAAGARQERDAKEGELRRRERTIQDENRKRSKESEDETNALRRQADNIRKGIVETNERREDAAIAAERKRFADRRKRLEDDMIAARNNGTARLEVLDAQSRLEAEREVFEAEAVNRRRDARLRDLEDLRRYQDELRSIYEQINEIERREQQQQLEDFERTSTDRTEIIRRRAALAVSFSEAERRANVEELKRERDARVAQENGLRKQLEITEAYNRRIEAEEQRHTDEKRRVKAQESRDLEREDPASARSIFGDVFADELARSGSVLSSVGTLAVEVFRQMGDAAGNAASMISGAVGSMAQGLGGMVEQWAMMGTIGPNAWRKLTASVLASLAAQSIVKAAFALAEGVGYKAKAAAAFAAGNVFSGLAYEAAAKQSFKSALLYGPVGGGAAIGARGIAGDAFASGGAGGGSAASAGSTQGRDTSRDTFTRDTRTAEGAVLNRLAAAVERLEGIPAEQIVRQGVERDPSIVGDGLIRNVQSDPDRIGRGLAPAFGMG